MENEYDRAVSTMGCYRPAQAWYPRCRRCGVDPGCRVTCRLWQGSKRNDRRRAPCNDSDRCKGRAKRCAFNGEWVGTLDGYVNAQIQPQANGYLIRQNYREGSQVHEGEVLFEIDPRPFEAALEQAQGQLGQAQAQLALAQINVNRDTPLAEAHAIARSQLDNEVQQKAQAEASVKTAEAAVATANLNLGFTKVRSLISGVAGQATTQVGNLVSTQSILTSVSQLNPIKVYFSISDSEYLALTKRAGAGGGDLLHGASNLPLTLTLSNGEVYPQKGHVVFVDRQLNSQTGAIRIAASLRILATSFDPASLEG